MTPEFYQVKHPHGAYRDRRSSRRPLLKFVKLNTQAVHIVKDGRQEDPSSFIKIEQCKKNNSRKNHKDN